MYIELWTPWTGPAMILYMSYGYALLAISCTDDIICFFSEIDRIAHTITARSCVSNQCHAVPEQQLKAKLSRRGMLAAFWSGMTVTIWLISRLYFMGFEPRALCLAYSTSAVFHLPELLRRPWGWPALTWPRGREHLAWVVGGWIQHLRFWVNHFENTGTW